MSAYSTRAGRFRQWIRGAPVPQAPPLAEGVPHPFFCDWAWRPALWSTPAALPTRGPLRSGTALGGEMTLYHDCSTPGLALAQMPNAPAPASGPYRLELDLEQCAGSFLSLALALPAAAMQGLARRHVIRLATRIETERPQEIFARLNIRHGPDSEQLNRLFPLGDSEVAVDFDLALSHLAGRPVQRLWLDLILDRPLRNRVTLHDLTLTRRPRAGC